MRAFPRRTIAFLALVLPFAVLSACGGDEPAPSYLTPVPTATAHSQPASIVWQPTGEYRTEHDGVGLTVFSFDVNWEHVRIRYAIDGPESAVELSPASIKLTDDLSEEYLATNSILGTSLGVTAGVLIGEPYKGEGKALTLTITDMTMATVSEPPTETIRGTWTLTFVENLDPGAPVDHHEGGRIAPEVVSSGDLTTAFAGPLGAGLIKFLIYRAGQQAALHGRLIDSVVRPYTEEQFRRLKPYDPPLPPGFPTPAVGE